MLSLAITGNDLSVVVNARIVLLHQLDFLFNVFNDDLNLLMDTVFIALVHKERDILATRMDTAISAIHVTLKFVFQRLRLLHCHQFLGWTNEAIRVVNIEARMLVLL